MGENPGTDSNRETKKYAFFDETKTIKNIINKS